MSLSQLFKRLLSRDNRWMTGPVAAAAVLVLLVLVKSCQGLVYLHSNEHKIHKLGYPIEEARILASTLSDAQADRLIASQEHDSLACSILNERYFILDNFDRYLAFHKADTTRAPLAAIVAIVNVGRDLDRDVNAVPCDTTKGILMLINGRHYLSENYKPDTLEKFEKTYCYEEQRALHVVVEAFITMQRECKKQTEAHLMVNSAYRSFQDQIGTYSRNDKKYVANPGFSEHQTGLALDVTSLQHPEKWSFDKSKEGVWMREHCHEYGFILRYPEKQSHFMGFSYEPWHLRYVGKEMAKRVHDEGITYDEYYAYYLDREKE